MKFKSQNGIYQIDLPDTYELKERENIVTIYQSNGVGVISITSYYVPLNYNFVIQNELLDFIGSIDESLVISNNDLTDCKANYCSYQFLDIRGKYWKVWVYFANNSSVFVSYNCDKSDKEIEIDNIDCTVKSLVVNNEHL